MKKQRPINLNFKTIYFPLSAIISILHRITGLLLFVGISILLWFFKLSTSNSEGFYQAVCIMHYNIAKLIIWGIFVIYIYHIISGIRHILMDFTFLKQTKKIGNISSIIVCILTVFLSIFFGFKICGFIVCLD